MPTLLLAITRRIEIMADTCEECNGFVVSTDSTGLCVFMTFLEFFQANYTIFIHIGAKVCPQIHFVFYPSFRRCIAETTDGVK